MALIENKKVRLNYEILKTFEAGLVLLGSEVKSLRGHRGSLEGSHITVRGSEAFLVGATIPPYQPSNMREGYDPVRNRKLLLNRKEIGEIGSAEGQKGLTVVPISVYNKKKNIKVELAIVRGKKKYDKREDLKKRTAKREMERTLKTKY